MTAIESVAMISAASHLFKCFIGVMAGEVYREGAGLHVGWAVYWKNGTPTELTTSDKVSQANAITLVNNDIYIAGSIGTSTASPRAAYWKNAVPVAPDNRHLSANHIAVHENYVYVVGQRGKDTAVYCKNEAPLILGNGSANAISIQK